MAKIKIMALGGLGENGKNMYLVDVNDRIFILDAGIKYPEVDMYGVDAVVPNISYLIENKNRIEGIFLSHGHVDNMGALVYLLKNISVKVYGTHLTISILESTLEANKMNIKKFKLYRINDSKTLKFNNVKVVFYNSTHSIPESLGIGIITEDGAIVYSTDFNFGLQFDGKYDTSFNQIAEISKASVLALLSESVGLSSINRVSNDTLLEYNYHLLLNKALKRIIVCAFSTDFNRIQKIIDLSLERGKKIAFIHNKNHAIKAALDNKYIRVPAESLIQLKPFDENNNNEIDNLVVIVTGERFEPYTMIANMSIGENKYINLNIDDKVVLMCPPIPGTEKYTTNAINTLSKNGCEIAVFDKTVLRSTHANREDLKLLYSMMKPKYAIPIKGEYRHLYDHKEIAYSLGYNDETCIMLDNGQVATFENGILTSKNEHIFVGDVFIDGKSTGDVNEEVIRERETLALDGVVVVNIIYDLRTRSIIGDPDINYKGVVYNDQLEVLNQNITLICLKHVNVSLTKKQLSLEGLKSTLVNEIGKVLHRILKKHPVVIINLLENK